jgi:hypothetical protein
MPHNQIFGEIFRAIKSATSDINVPDEIVSEATGAALAVIIHHEHMQPSERSARMRGVLSEGSMTQEGTISCPNNIPANQL